MKDYSEMPLTEYDKVFREIFLEHDRKLNHLYKIYTKCHYKAYFASDILKLNNWLNSEREKIEKEYIEKLKGIEEDE